MRVRPGSWSGQTTMSGLGQHFERPCCPRDTQKTQMLVPVSIVEIKHCRLLARLNELESKQSHPREDSAALHDEIFDEDVEIGDDPGYFDPRDPDYVCIFQEGKFQMVQRQQQIMGKPSEREALLTILLNMPARECLEVISLWGAKELYCQLKAGRIYTCGLFVHVSMCM
jgi:hypothetical protein